jgi:hypothetical protein
MAGELAWNKGLVKSIYGSIVANGYLIHTLARKFKSLTEEEKIRLKGAEFEIYKADEKL